MGCGNGYTCCQLAEQGYTNLTGIDYSENAIKLAKSVSEKENLNIEYKVNGWKFLRILKILNDKVSRLLIY